MNEKCSCCFGQKHACGCVDREGGPCPKCGQCAFHCQCWRQEYTIRAQRLMEARIRELPPEKRRHFLAEEIIKAPKYL